MPGKLSASVPSRGSADRLLIRTSKTAPGRANKPGGDKVEYWGHYPVADLEYSLDLPITLGVRAWSPFIPGDENSMVLWLGGASPSRNMV